MKFKHHYNRQNFLSDHEVNDHPSETLPDQSMSVKEIMRRYANGLHTTGERVPLYEGEELTPNFQNMDLADRQQFVEEKTLELEELQDKIKRSRRPSFPKAQDKEQQTGSTQAKNEEQKPGEDTKALA
ncbi:MAG: hypothetical protein [Microviridae sp.]|nr:MAG: hypothetical protein [Microviridae sp.]